MLRPITAGLALGCAQAVLADVNIRFIEGAPTDRFVISSPSGICADGPVLVTIDLTETAGRLVFDVTSEGAGVEVFQPLVFVAGEAFVAEATRLQDGDNTLSVRLSQLPAGAEVAFTLDVDDTVGTREITVSGQEFAGASVRVSAGEVESTAGFGRGNTAVVPWPACLS